MLSGTSKQQLGEARDEIQYHKNPSFIELHVRVMDQVTSYEVWGQEIRINFYEAEESSQRLKRIPL